jgi:hypothetical protein
MVRSWHDAPVFHHVALFRWNDGTTAEQVAAVRDRLLQLPGQIPEIRVLRVGSDLGWVDGNYDFAVVADFDSEEAWRTYADHPVHQAVITETVRPLVASRTALQFETDL